MLRDLSALKAAVIGACALTAALIACLLLRVFRSGKRIKKTRKYDIITTPAERVEMAPLNEEDDEDEDSTVFDVKYRNSERLEFSLIGFSEAAEQAGCASPSDGEQVGKNRSRGEKCRHALERSQWQWRWWMGGCTEDIQ
ncbi:membrane protein FAM174B, partial [Lamprotornis superbus]